MRVLHDSIELQLGEILVKEATDVGINRGRKRPLRLIPDARNSDPRSKQWSVQRGCGSFRTIRGEAAESTPVSLACQHIFAIKLLSNCNIRIASCITGRQKCHAIRESISLKWRFSLIRTKELDVSNYNANRLSRRR